jgi:hypothetical protein
MTVRLLPCAEAAPIPGVDPHAAPAALQAEAAQRWGRAVVAEIEVPALRVAYPLLLVPGGAHGVLARTPEYGGPYRRAGRVDARTLAAVRTELDRALPDHGVVSEVFMLAPDLPARDLVAAVWSTADGKEIRVVDPAAVAAGDGLRKGRRSDLARARREADVAVRSFDGGAVDEFAVHYARAMDAMQAADRWRRDRAYFGALAGGNTLYAEARTEGGGAAALFLTAGPRASYAYSVRWGASGTATTLVLHEACVALATAGVLTLTLGGGATDASDDPLLEFKRSWGGEAVPFRIGARVYDPDAHAALVEADAARPLPVGAVRP